MSTNEIVQLFLILIVMNIKLLFITNETQFLKYNLRIQRVIITIIILILLIIY